MGNLGGIIGMYLGLSFFVLFPSPRHPGGWNAATQEDATLKCSRALPGGARACTDPIQDLNTQLPGVSFASVVAFMHFSSLARQSDASMQQKNMQCNLSCYPFN
ncbi:hypothetical protein MTO96_026079 [Rhipicephalus appendiculatus]